MASVKGNYLKDESGNIISPVVNVKTIFGDNGKTLLDLFYPVGSYYETSDSSFDPNKVWGGTWAKENSGRFLISERATSSPLTVGEVGGSSTHSHVLSNNGYAYIANIGGGGGGVIAKEELVLEETFPACVHTLGNTSDGVSRWVTPLGGATDNGDGMPPYLVVCRWHRTK